MNGNFYQNPTFPTLEDNTLSLGFNLRVPVTIDYNIIEKEFKKFKKVLDKRTHLLYNRHNLITETIEAEVKLQAHPQRVSHS